MPVELERHRSEDSRRLAARFEREGLQNHAPSE
jgi:hypothetical protein